MVRTVAVLTGSGLDLTVIGDAPVRLIAASVPFAFPADAPCPVRLLAGPATDFNVTTRRMRFGQMMRHLDLIGPATLDIEGGTMLVLYREGRIATEDTCSGLATT